MESMMEKLCGTRTEENLRTAFAGESQARNKYTYYAKKAEEDGMNQIAEIFRITALNEEQHAKIWFKLLNDGIGSTEENLKNAAEGEHFEWAEMYADFAKTAEEFYVAALDDRRTLLRFERLSYGTANTTSVSAAQVVEFAVRWRATGVILAHNHPRGVPLPSNSDLAVTKNLLQALSVVNIELVDHFIFCDADYLSFAGSNYMDSVKGYKGAAPHGTL